MTMPVLVEKLAPIAILVTVITNLICFVVTPFWLYMIANQEGSPISFVDVSTKLFWSSQSCQVCELMQSQFLLLKTHLSSSGICSCLLATFDLSNNGVMNVAGVINPFPFKAIMGIVLSVQCKLLQKQRL